MQTGGRLERHICSGACPDKTHYLAAARKSVRRNPAGAYLGILSSQSEFGHHVRKSVVESQLKIGSHTVR